MAILAKARERASLGDVDFKNFAYAWPGYGAPVPSMWRWLNEPPRVTVKLQNGARNLDEKLGAGAPFLQLQSVVFGELTGDGEAEAAVDLLYGTGGTAKWHYVWVYTRDNGSPKLLGVLQSGSRADGGLIRMAIEDHALILDFADTKRRSADCCSDGYVRVQYVWRDGQFRETGARAYGDLR
jgi:hypothetical protein